MMFSLTDLFTSKVDHLNDPERDALFLGMGDGSALESAGLIARNNAANKDALEIDRRRRKKDTYERALELLSNRLTNIENQMLDLEQRIADSREIIQRNNSDIEFIRSLDTQDLHQSDGTHRPDVQAFLEKHGYENLDKLSEQELRHILTAIEVRAIEQNEQEQDNIEQWRDRHDRLRQDAQDAARGSKSDHHSNWADCIAGRDPEQLARHRMEALTAKSELASELANAERVLDNSAKSSGFDLGGMANGSDTTPQPNGR